MRNRVAVWVNLVFASIVVVGVFLQAYFIASYASGAGEGALDAHSFTGGIVVHLSELIVFISALVAFWGAWRWIGVNFLLILLGTIQIFLAPPDEDPASGWIHGLHGLFALFVLVLAAVIARRDVEVLALRRAPAEDLAASRPPAAAEP
jgi:MYXO-CTERM domain-containing protein